MKKESLINELNNILIELQKTPEGAIIDVGNQFGDKLGNWNLYESSLNENNWNLEIIEVGPFKY